MQFTKTIKLEPTDIISKMIFFGKGRINANQYAISWMFNIKFMLLFGKILTNRCFYFFSDFVIESDLSKLYTKEKA